MTVSTTGVRSGPYNPNGVTTAFPFNFRAVDEDDVQVIRIAVSGAITELSPTLYDVTITSNGGTVKFTAPPGAGDPLFVQMSPSFQQQISLENEGAFLPEVISEALDRGAQRSLYLRDRVERSIATPLGETPLALPGASARATSIFGFDGLGRFQSLSYAGLSGVLTPLLVGSLPPYFKGDPGGNSMSVGAASAVSAITISAGTDAIYTASAVTTSRRGGARFRLSDDQASAANGVWRLRSANGRYFDLDEQTPDTFMFGGVGDGIADDTAAIQAQHDYCKAKSLVVTLAQPPVTWRTTATIEASGPLFKGINGKKIPWWFNPPNPETLPDMTAALHITNTYGVFSDIMFRGPHAWNPRGSDFINDVSQGPQSADGGWYQGFFKTGCCAIKVDDFSQVMFEHIWTSYSQPATFKVGIFFDTEAGHCTDGIGCKHFDLIGVRFGRNSDDFMFDGEPVITNNFAAFLCGTSNLNGTFNGGAGIRKLAAYFGACCYGMLQMYDHGPKGTALPNPGLPVTGIYGNLNEVFMEFIGEAGVQFLPNAICRDFDYQDMARFSWEYGFRLPDVMASDATRQRYAFRLGRIGANVKLGTTRSKPSYRSDLLPGGQSIFASIITGGDSVVIAQQLLGSTVVADAENSSDFFDRAGRVLHRDDLFVRPDVFAVGNLYLPPLSPTNWQGAQPSAASGAGVIDVQPTDMKVELGINSPTISFPAGAFSALPINGAPLAGAINLPFLTGIWLNVKGSGASVLARILGQDGSLHYSATFFPNGWQHIVLGGAHAPMNVAPIRLELNVNSGTVYVASVMGSLGQVAPFNSSTAPRARTFFQASAGLEVDNDFRLFGMPTYADNAAASAGGLAVGNVYKTATGQLMVRY